MTEQTAEDSPDYYIENGLVVFTAEFLKRRGFCCRSGCRHCPYGFDKSSTDQQHEGDP